jgi:hypothetical protein
MLLLYEVISFRRFLLFMFCCFRRLPFIFRFRSLLLFCYSGFLFNGCYKFRSSEFRRKGERYNFLL